MSCDVLTRNGQTLEDVGIAHWLLANLARTAREYEDDLSRHPLWSTFTEQQREVLITYFPATGIRTPEERAIRLKQMLAVYRGRIEDHCRRRSQLPAELPARSKNIFSIPSGPLGDSAGSPGGFF